MKQSPYLKYKDDFIKLYEEGKSIREIAKIYDIPNHGSVSRIIKGAVQLRPKTLLKNEEVLLEAIRLYKEGYSINAISKRLGIGNSTLKNKLSKYIDINTEYKYEELLEKIKYDYKEGMSSREIANKYSLSAQTICNYLHLEKEKVREGEEASRKHFLDVDYFKTEILSLDKISVLAMLPNKTRFYDNNRIKISGSLSEYNKIYQNIISKFSDDRAIRIIDNKYFIYELKSEVFVSNMINAYDNILLTEFREFFIDELIKYNTSVTAKYVSISARYLNKDLIVKYLVSLGIKEKFIRFYNKSQIYIQEKSNVYKLVQAYPFILDKIKEKAKTEILWENFLNKYYNK